MSKDGAKRKRDEIENQNSAFQPSKKRDDNQKSSSRNGNRFAVIKGPGIFVSCVRGKEKKAAFELIDILEELVTKNGRNDEKGLSSANLVQPKSQNDIESQIESELHEFKQQAFTKGHCKGQSGKEKRFVPIFTDMECFFFIKVRDPLDPVKLTYELMEDVQKTKIAKSRFVHRLSPVSDTCFADIQDLTELIDRLITRETFFSSKDLRDSDFDLTFKVDMKMRLNDKLNKSEIIQMLADRMPKFAKAKLDSPEFVINVEVFRMTVGIAIVRHFDHYRKFNPIMLARHQQSQITANEPSSEQTISRVTNPLST